MSESILSVKLDAFYGNKQVLRGVEFDLCRGDVLGLIGTSGAGKSTLVLALLGLLMWRGGRAKGVVELRGRNLLELSEREVRKMRGKDIAIVPQSPSSALNPAVSIGVQFKENWLAHEQQLGGLSARVDELMEEVGLPNSADFMRRRPAQISVGQAQRVVLALALLHRPAILLADEPTSALDPVTQSNVVKLLQEITRTQKATAMLYVSHDLISLLRIATKMATLDNGSIAEIVPIDLLCQSTHAKTRALLETLPVPLEALVRPSQREEISILYQNGR